MHYEHWKGVTMFTRMISLFPKRISFKFLAVSSIVVAVVFVLGFLWISGQQEEHIMEQVRKQAVILHKQVILTRQWVSSHGSVLIEKGPGVRSSPFLEEPDVVAKDGTVYTKITPSILTTSLSDIARTNGSYYFKLTNTDFLNPRNAPDKIELAALQAFRSHSGTGFFETDVRHGQKTLRYVAPVSISDKCLQCHMTQGYKAGDVGGCLSVFIPMEDAAAAIRYNNVVLLAGGVVFAGTLVVLMFASAQALVFKRIGTIRSSMVRLSPQTPESLSGSEGDELKEIQEFCYIIDERLKNQHEELEKKIAEATRDLGQTNANLGKANAELLALNQAKSDFFSDISHELRTPLTSIKGAADILARKGSCDDPSYVDIIKRNTEHLVKTVQDFLDYSKIESGQLDLNVEKGSLKAVAEDALLSYKALAQKKAVKLVLDVKDDPEVAFDQERIYQVLTNLLSNAVKFSPENGTVILRIFLKNGNIHVSVEDDGPGIEKKYHAAVFEKFYQVPDRKANRIHKGSSGIGLAICKGLVEAHGGTIWVASEPNKGSCFSFALPVSG